MTSPIKPSSIQSSSESPVPFTSGNTARWTGPALSPRGHCQMATARTTASAAATRATKPLRGRPSVVGAVTATAAGFCRRRVGKLCHELVAVAMHGTDDVLAIGRIAHGPARFHDGAGQRCLADNRAAPDGGLDIVLVNGALALGDEIGEQIEDPRLQRHQLVVAP